MYRVCFTGYRPAKLPFKCSPEDHNYLSFCQKAEGLLAGFLQKGAVHFLSGMAQGSDMILAQCALALKAQSPDITLECVLPFPAQTKGWGAAGRQMHGDILKKCDKITVISQEYTPQSYMQRNRYLVDNSEAVVAVYDGQKGGSKNTLDYAFKMGRQVMIINPQSLHTIQLDMLI